MKTREVIQAGGGLWRDKEAVIIEGDGATIEVQPIDAEKAEQIALAFDEAAEQLRER